MHDELQRAESQRLVTLSQMALFNTDGGIIKMQIRCKTVLNVGLALCAPFLAAGFLDAQIIDQIDVNIQHSFMIRKKTLPPGKYVFQIDQGSDEGVMVLSTADGKHLDQFTVRDSIAHQRDQEIPN